MASVPRDPIDNQNSPKLNFGELLTSAVSQGATISIKAKTEHLDFTDGELRMYAAIGKYVSEIANLEFDLDDFIFSFAKFFPKLAFSISKNVPLKIEEKAEFFAYAHVLNPKLRECGDLDGSLDLKYLFYGIIELFDSRNSIIHGSISFTRTKEDNFSVRVQKYTRISKNKYDIEDVKYGSGYIEKSLKEAHYIRTFIWRAKSALTGTKRLPKERDDLLKGRALWRTLMRQSQEGDE